MELGNLATSVLQGILQGAVWFIVIAFIGATSYFGTKFFLKELRYKFIVRIFEKDSFGNITEKTDRGGIFKDRKTRRELFI